MFPVVTFPVDLAQFWGSVRLPHDHTHQVWHNRPPVPCAGSHTRWCDAIRNWLPFQLTWTLWVPGLLWHTDGD